MLKFHIGSGRLIYIWDSGHLTYEGALEVGKEFYDKYSEPMFLNVEAFSSDAILNNTKN
jgi:hypothetical protein